MKNILLVFPYNVTNLKDFEEIVNKFEVENYIIHYFEGINNENLFVDGLFGIVENMKKSYTDINKIVVLSNIRELICSWYRCYNGLVDEYVYYIDSNNNFFIKKDEYYLFFKNLADFKNIEKETLFGKIYINIDSFNYLNIYDFLFNNSNFRYFKDFRDFDFNKKEYKLHENKIYIFKDVEYYFEDLDKKSKKYYIELNENINNFYDMNLINTIIENIYFVKYLLIKLYNINQTAEVSNFLIVLFEKLGEYLIVEDRESILEDIINYLYTTNAEFKERIYILSLCVQLKSNKDSLAKNIMKTLLDDRKNIEYHYAVLYNILFYQTHCNMKIYDEIYLHRRYEIIKIADYFRKKGNIRSRINKKVITENLDEKKSFKIAIHYDQLLSLNHSPTKLCLDLSKNFKKYYPNFKIKIFVEDNLIISNKEIIYPYHFSSVASSYCKEQHKEYLKGCDVDIYYSNPCISKQDRTNEIVREINKFSPHLIYTTSDLSVAREILYPYFPTIFLSHGEYNFSTLADYYIYDGELKQKFENLNSMFNLINPHKILEIKTGVEFDSKVNPIDDEEYHIYKNEFVAITIGNRLDVELTEMFIDSVCSVILDLKNIKWYIVGNKKIKHIENKYKQLINDRRIVLIEYENNLSSLYNKCDVYLNPIREGGGMSIALAMNQKLPVIVLKGSLHGQIWVGEENCVNSMEEYIKKLMMMYENVDYKRQNGELMKERLNIFSYSNFIDNIIRVMKMAIREFNIRRS